MEESRTDESYPDSYQVKLQGFEGPLELLLHLIKENRVNIYDIPIALITRQYLAYLDLMQSLNLAIAGEFLVMASTLLLIKSRMLLPQAPADEEDGEDPREDLVRRLLEYQRYRDAAEKLEERESIWREIFRRSVPPEKEGAEVYLVDLNPFDLLSALQKVLERAPKEVSLQFSTENLSVADRIQYLLDRFEQVESLTFDALFDPTEGRAVIIVTFLALLEAVRLGVLRVLQVDFSEGKATDIRIYRTENLTSATQEFTREVSNGRD